MGFASNAHEQYVSHQVDYEHLESAEARLMALNIGGIAAATATVGFGTVLVVMVGGKHRSHRSISSGG